MFEKGKHYRCTSNWIEAYPVPDMTFTGELIYIEIDWEITVTRDPQGEFVEIDLNGQTLWLETVEFDFFELIEE